MRPVVPVLVLALTAIAACASPRYGPPPPPSGPAFDPAELAWSQRPGVAAIRGQLSYTGAMGAYTCRNAVVALMPDSPYSRRRIQRLYGAVDRAAVPVSVVRSRQAGQPSDAFQKLVRTSRCDADSRFGFDQLPQGGWFVIVQAKPHSGEGEAVALLRRVQTGRTPQVRSVVLQ